MTLDEAILHAREVAEQKRKYIQDNKGLESTSYYDKNCVKCAEEHEQLAEWLEELQTYRQQHLVICEKHNVNTIEELYNKAIDDACGYIKCEWSTDNIHYCTDFDNIAAQLKVGYIND